MGTMSEKQKVAWDSGSQRVFFWYVLLNPRSEKCFLVLTLWQSRARMGNNVILKLIGKRKTWSLAMCGIIWQITFIMSNIYTSSWVLQLGILFPLCSTLRVEAQGENDPVMNVSRAAYTFIRWLPENIETRVNELRSPLYLSNAALLWQHSWLDHQDWLSVKGSTLSVSPQDNILQASCNWLMVSQPD